MRILTICPTKNRTHQVKEMIASFNRTSTENNTLILGINAEDEDIFEYRKLSVTKSLCKANSTVTEVINSIWKENPGYDFYHITNDDVVYETKGWDTKFAHILDEYGHGIAYGNDTIQGKNLCTFPFISSEILDALGWAQLPALNRYCGDSVFNFIGKQCSCLYYLDGVTIRHNWGGANSEVHKSDMEKFAEWLPYSYKYVEKVKEILK